MEMRIANNEERTSIRSSFYKREISSLVLTALFDAFLLVVIIFMYVKVFDAITIFVSLFLAGLFLVTFRTILRSLRSIHYIRQDELKIVDCMVENADTKSVGLIKSSYVTVVDKSGETYSMSYTSPFVSNIFKGQKVTLVQLGSVLEMVI